MIFQSLTEVALRKKSQCFPIDPMTPGLSSGALPLSYSRLRPLNSVHVTNVLYTAGANLNLDMILCATIEAFTFQVLEYFPFILYKCILFYYR